MINETQKKIIGEGFFVGKTFQGVISFTVVVRFALLVAKNVSSFLLKPESWSMTQ